MKSQTQQQANVVVMPPFIADSLALNLLNTVVMVDGERIDLLSTDADVVTWLTGADVEIDKETAIPPSSLLTAARTLREIVRVLVTKRKAGSHADVRALNQFLTGASSHPQLVWTGRRRPEIVRQWEGKGPARLLAPVAEATAELLANGDFDLVRKCEDGGCVLWFYDRTKSHRRRWCSMAACGNRNKVKAFRQRQRG